MVVKSVLKLNFCTENIVAKKKATHLRKYNWRELAESLLKHVLLMFVKPSPITNTILFFPFLEKSESPKESSEPTGSPAPVIQHSSVTASPNGLNVRSAAEAVATSVLTQMANQRTELNVPIQSHVIMAPQSQSAGR